MRRAWLSRAPGTCPHPCGVWAWHGRPEASSTAWQVAAWSRQRLSRHARAPNVHPLLPGQVQQTLAHSCGPLQLPPAAVPPVCEGVQAQLS